MIFIQTIQAVIYALKISLIVKIQFNKIDDVNDRNSSIGFLADIALLSVFKIEEYESTVIAIKPTQKEFEFVETNLSKLVEMKKKRANEQAL